MPTLPLPRLALAGGPADAFAGRGWRMSRPAIVVSILAHLAALFAVGRWYADAPAPLETKFEWLATFETPREPVVEPTPEVVEPAAPTVIEPAPRTVAPRAAPPPVVAPPQPEASIETPPAPIAPSRFDLDAVRRAAAASVVGEHAGDGKVREALIEDAPPPWPLTPAPKKPSIFEPQRHSGGGFLSPGKARTAAGMKLSLWCNKVSGGGFGFFGIPVCMSGRIEPPSGIMADSIPEYMKLKPECEETQPLAATLGETSAYPTTKCRLVPKDPDE
jgi:hypothetical protein